MSGTPTPRGGAPVGRLDDLEPLEAAAVVYVRLWCSGPECQERVWNDFAARFGAPDGKAHLAAFERMMKTLVAHARCPIMRHHNGCRCLGSHECALANLIGAAAEANREEAVLLASLLVRPDMATVLAAEAEQVGLALRRLLLRARPAAAEAPDDAPTHTATGTRH